MWWWLWVGSGLVAFVWGALWWSRRLMEWGARLEPYLFPPPVEAAPVFGNPEIVAFDAHIRAYRRELQEKACFACGHLPVAHLDPRALCTCCHQHELVDVEID